MIFCFFSLSKKVSNKEKNSFSFSKTLLLSREKKVTEEKLKNNFLIPASSLLARFSLLVRVGYVPLRPAKFPYVKALHVQCRSWVDHQVAIVSLHYRAIKVAK